MEYYSALKRKEPSKDMEETSRILLSVKSQFEITCGMIQTTSHSRKCNTTETIKKDEQSAEDDYNGEGCAHVRTGEYMGNFCTFFSSLL